MYRRFMLLSLLILTAGLVSAQARTVKLQPIDCSMRGEKEYCTSKNKQPLNGKIAVQRGNGNLAGICDFKKGYRDGESLFYDDNGRLTEKVIFKDGIKDGITQYYHKNGKVWLTAPYIKGVLHGSADVYDSRGKVRGKFKYNKGKLKWGYCIHKGHKIKYPNSKSSVALNQLVTCGTK